MEARSVAARSLAVGNAAAGRMTAPRVPTGDNMLTLPETTMMQSL